MKIVNRKFIPYVLVASMLLTGCGKQKNNGNSSINVTPTIPSQISNTPSEDSKVQTYEEKAQETYSENIQFYTNLGLAYAYNGETNIDRIENMLKTINGNVSDLTQSQVNDSCEAIKNVLLSQELTSYLNDVNSYELGYLSTLDDASLIYPASLVKYVTNSETKEILMEFENIRNKVINDLNTSKKGQYTVKYTVEDSDNNKTEHTLVINISNDKSSSDNNVNDNKNNNTSDKNNSNSNSNSNKPNTNNTSQKTTKDKDEKVTDKSSNYNNSTTNSNVTNNNRSYSSKNYNSSENENEVEENDTVTKDDQEINNHDYEEETYNDGQKSLNKVENKKDGVKEKKDNNSIEYIVRIILIAITIVGLVEVICYNRKR